ncbi:MAG TPA: UDP-N-acetylmuramoyl-tripeptide--D-alanyl-D-alanine ligase [Candidatus Binataceae bacterium]|nr:UDP-N-acetylmuramoyl-tripeptide--D-alanyl-D-alanine ligase [Candidatus Binataceae bacterium]
MATPIPLNQCGLTADEVIRATTAQPSGGATNIRAACVSIDTRTITPGALFVALRGVRDGHEFLRTAAERGAVAAVVERGRGSNALPCFEVDDTLSALRALARHHLERMRAAQSLAVIAVGGAAGKTTTKELSAAVARSLFGETLATPGNLNNLIGVPMTTLTLRENHRAAVLECGTNRRGEIPLLAEMVRPEVALVLNVDIEHTEGLGSLEGVADEEAALFGPARVAVTSADEPLLMARVPAEKRRFTFGTGSDADVRLTRRTVVAPGFQQISLALPPATVARGVEPKLDATLNLLGAASASNAAAAVAAAIAAWNRPLGHAELAAIAMALESIAPVEGRLRTRQARGLVIIDDTYNANPRSVRAALAAARETADGLEARLIVALGDMLELGGLSGTMHAEAIRDVLAARPSACIAVGGEMAAAVNACADAGSSNHPVTMVAPDSEAAASLVRDIVRPGDVLLVKGSRGIAMERIIEALCASDTSYRSRPSAA